MLSFLDAIKLNTFGQYLTAGLILILAVLVVTLIAGAIGRAAFFERDPDDIGLTGGQPASPHPTSTQSDSSRESGQSGGVATT